MRSSSTFFLSALVLFGCSAGTNPPLDNDNPSGGMSGSSAGVSGGGAGGSGGQAGSGAKGGSSAGSGGVGGGTGGGAGTGGSAGQAGSGGSGGSLGGSGGTGGTAGIGGMGGMGGMPDPCEYPQWVPGTDYVVGDRVLRNTKGYMCVVDNPGYDPEISTSYWNDLGCTNDSGTGGTGGFPGECVLNDLLPEGPKTFSDFFDNPPWQGHVRNEVFADGYNKLCQSLIDYPGLNGFGKSGTEEQNKRELAAFFANVAQETAYLEKPVQDVGGGGEYLGRGSIQITGSVIYAEADNYLNAGIYQNPDLVGSDPILVWATGVWYWMMHSNPSVGGASICHDSIMGGEFGHTVRIIKGDCGSSGDRAANYESLCTTLGIDATGLDCY